MHEWCHKGSPKYAKIAKQRVGKGSSEVWVQARKMIVDLTSAKPLKRAQTYMGAQLLLFHSRSENSGPKL